MFNRLACKVTSSSLAFFSEHRIHSLSQRLGNDRLNQLVETIESVIRSRLLAEGPSSKTRISFRKPSDPVQIPLDKATLYIQSYFSQMHPFYPFLDRKEFEEKALGPAHSQILSSSCAFSALYHAILALGCQYHDGGAFDPGNGRAWKLFQVSLGLVSEILIPREALTSLQALVAMSIFARTTCCIQIDEILVMEAARMALGLGYHRALGDGDQRQKNTCHRTFWVIYYMEKGMCFQSHKGSMIPDYDVGSPVPEVPESVLGGYNWFVSAIGFGRILSLAYTTLFSVSATSQSPEAYHDAIAEVETRLERWRTAIPLEFRPEVPLAARGGPSSLLGPGVKMAALQTKFSYYGLVIALARLKMYVGQLDPSRSQDLERSKRLLMDTARAVVEDSRDIDIAAHTPNFVLAVLPLAALFILFDFIVHNPTHPETHNNLSLLDVVAGHFSLLDYKSGGFMPASLLTEFAHIARQYVKDSGSLRPRQRGEEEPCELGSSSAESRMVAPGHMPSNPTNNHSTNVDVGDVELHDGIMNPWESSDYLYYPVLPDFTIQGDGPESYMAAPFNVQNFFGLVIPEIGHDEVV